MSFVFSLVRLYVLLYILQASIFKFYVKFFLCDGQSAVRQTILYVDRSCIYDPADITKGHFKSDIHDKLCFHQSISHIQAITLKQYENSVFKCMKCTYKTSLSQCIENKEDTLTLTFKLSALSSNSCTDHNSGMLFSFIFFQPKSFIFDSICTRRLTELLTSNFIKLTMLPRYLL